jgi:hypothetical protein
LGGCYFSAALFMDAILSAFDREFLLLDSRSRALLAKTDDAQLFAKPRQIANSMAMFSCGEYVARSAAMVEKSFGGITTRLWDDPFEWTLPEELSDRSGILNYLDEVERTRAKGFSFFTSDADLRREIPAPEKLRPIIDILTDTLARSAHFQGRAFAVFQLLSEQKLPQL